MTIVTDVTDVRRVLLTDADPAGEATGEWEWIERGTWPVRWIACARAAEAGDAPFVTAYRLRFTLDAATRLRVHVSADERYELFVDGARAGSGPERGDADHWFFETYDLDLPAGAHTLVARVWTMGFERTAFAQMSVHPGFLLCPEGGEEAVARFGTGVAPWEAKRLGGYAFVSPQAAWGTGANVVIDGDAREPGVEAGEGEGWTPAVPTGEAKGASSPRRNDVGPVHRLRPATLLPQVSEPWTRAAVRHVADLADAPDHKALDGVTDVPRTADIPVRAEGDLPGEHAAWAALLAGGDAPLTIPPRTRRRVLLDLTDYLCAYPGLETEGGAGALVRVSWQETLYAEIPEKHGGRWPKGNRDEIEGKFFVTVWSKQDGIGDLFKIGDTAAPGEVRRFDTPWWQCGRYVEVVVTTADAPLTLRRLTLRETRYPLEREATFASSDGRHEAVAPILVRALQMCSHETYMDCPYFEQLQYIGDTRLQVLATFASTPDDRLPCKALAMFDASRLLSGLTQSRYPSRVRQVIPPFSLWHVAMLHDYALWRDDPAFVGSLLPGARGVIDHYAGLMNGDGLVGPAEGWNYTDWVPAWKSGVPPGGADGVSAPLCFQFAYVLRLYAELEDAHGEAEFAARARRLHRGLCDRAVDAFWEPSRGLLADDLGRTAFSEHAQCLALLADAFPNGDGRRDEAAKGLLDDPDLARMTIYFSHYLFETLYRLGRADRIQKRLEEVWFPLAAMGFKTTYEEADPNTTRSDCHAWGAHPLYHFAASILGVRPDAPGFARVRVAPLLGDLTHASGTVPHPRGWIRAELRADETGALSGTVELPAGVSGVFVAPGTGTETPLSPGVNAVG